MLKIVLLVVKNMFFVLNVGISKKVGQIAQKHTATGKNDAGYRCCDNNLNSMQY